jgi:hypothetical protein
MSFLQVLEQNNVLVEVKREIDLYFRDPNDNESISNLYLILDNEGFRGPKMIDLVSKLQRELKVKPGLYGMLGYLADKYKSFLEVLSNIKPKATPRVSVPKVPGVPKLNTSSKTEITISVTGPSGRVWNYKCRSNYYKLKAVPENFWPKDSVGGFLHQLFVDKPTSIVDATVVLNSEKKSRTSVAKFLEPYMNGMHLQSGWVAEEVTPGVFQIVYSDPHTGKYVPEVQAIAKAVLTYDFNKVEQTS